VRNVKLVTGEIECYRGNKAAAPSGLKP